MKTLLIIGTGGTIAGAAADPGQTVGYTYGAVSVQNLVDAVPGLTALARIRSTQPYSIGSEHLGSRHWLTLIRLVRGALADPALDGIVITHGTDTLEETAFVLDLTTPRTRPVVITGAMRPSTAIGADGPANLAAACRFALAATDPSDPLAPGPGVLVAVNDTAFGAVHLAKRHTTRVDAFAARDDASVGIVLSGSVCWRGRLGPSGPFAATPLPDAMPKVALIWQHVDCDESIVGWLLGRDVKGIILAGTGNGTMPSAMRSALARASASGCRIVRASRVADGPVLRNAEADPADRDDALGSIAAGWLAPLKARLLLQWCLVAGLDPAAIQQRFDRYR